MNLIAPMFFLHVATGEYLWMLGVKQTEKEGSVGGCIGNVGGAYRYNSEFFSTCPRHEDFIYLTINFFI